MPLEVGKPTEETRKNLQWELTTTSVTPDQQVGTYTVPNGKVYVITGVFIEVVYTTPDATLGNLGTVEVLFNSVKEYGTFRAVNPSSGAPFGFSLPIPEQGQKFIGDGSKALLARCTPSSTTSTRWIVNITGYLEEDKS